MCPLPRDGFPAAERRWCVSDPGRARPGTRCRSQVGRKSSSSGWPTKSGLHPVPAVKIHLKREYHEHPVDAGSDSPNPILPPGPELGADVVDNRHARTRQAPGQPEVEFRKVQQEGDRRPAPLYFPHQGAIGANVLPQVCERIARTDACQVSNVGQQFDSGRAHSVAAGADKSKRAGTGGFFESLHNAGGVAIRRRLTGDDQDTRPIVLYRHARSLFMSSVRDHAGGRGLGLTRTAGRVGSNLGIARESASILRPVSRSSFRMPIPIAIPIPAPTSLTGNPSSAKHVVTLIENAGLPGRHGILGLIKPDPHRPVLKR